MYCYDRCLKKHLFDRNGCGMATANAYTAALAASPDSTKNYGCEYTLCSDAMYISVDIWASGPLSFGERWCSGREISSIPYPVFILVAELKLLHPARRAKANALRARAPKSLAARALEGLVTHEQPVGLRPRHFAKLVYNHTHIVGLHNRIQPCW